MRWRRFGLAVLGMCAVAGCSRQKADVRGGTETEQPHSVRRPGQPIDLSVQQAGPGSVEDSQQVPPQGLTAPIRGATSNTNPLENQEPDAAPTQSAAALHGER